MKKKILKVKKIKGKNLSGPVFVFPGPEGWELWSTADGEAQCMGPAEDPQKLRAPNQAVVCLPSRSFLSVPLWISVEEGIAPRDLAKIALEARNMLGANPDLAVWGMESIRTEPVAVAGQDEPGLRQLEATAILAGPLEENWLLEQAGRHEIAGRVLPAPGGVSSAVLRKELGRWVVDFYSGGKWLHTQPLLARELQAGTATEVGALLAQLEAEGTLPELNMLTLREEGDSGAGVQEFLSLLPCPVRTESRVAPRLPAGPWDLQPPLLTERRLAKTEQAKKTRTIRTSLAAYVVLILAALVYFAVPLIQLQKVEKELAGIAPDAGKIREASQSWQEAAALVNPKMNALELLWQVARPLIEKDPGEIDGVRLTTFDFNTKRLLLQGEGKDLEQTEKYFEWLKKEPMLSEYQWRHPQPTLLPNGNARFQVEGIPAGTEVAKDEEGGSDANVVAP
jgi:hypothetical protein